MKNIALSLLTLSALSGLNPSLAAAATSFESIGRELAQATQLCAINLCFPIAAGPIRVYEERRLPTRIYPESLAEGVLAEDFDFVGLHLPRGTRVSLPFSGSSPFDVRFRSPGEILLGDLSFVSGEEIEVGGYYFSELSSRIEVYGGRILYRGALARDATVAGYPLKALERLYLVAGLDGRDPFPSTAKIAHDFSLGNIADLGLTVDLERDDQISTNPPTDYLHLSFVRPRDFHLGASVRGASFGPGLSVTDLYLQGDSLLAAPVLFGIRVAGQVMLQGGHIFYGEPDYGEDQLVQGVHVDGSFGDLRSGIFFRNDGRVLRIKGEGTDNLALLPPADLLVDERGHGLRVGSAEVSFAFDEDGQIVAEFIEGDFTGGSFFGRLFFVVHSGPDGRREFLPKALPTGDLLNAFDLDSIEGDRELLLKARSALLDFTRR